MRRMASADKPRALVLIDVGSRSPGPFDVIIPELGDDLRRLAKVRPRKASDIAGDWRRFREYLRAEEKGEPLPDAPVKMNARLVRELLDVLPDELRVDYNRRQTEIEVLAENIASAREDYYRTGDPVIYTQSVNPTESGTKKVFHPAIAPSASDAYVRIGEDSNRIVYAVRKRVVEGGEVTLSGGYFKACVAQTAVLLAAEGFDVLVPEELTDAKIIRDSKDGIRKGEMMTTFMNTIYTTASMVQELIEPAQICIHEEKKGDYPVWRFRKEKSEGTG